MRRAWMVVSVMVLLLGSGLAVSGGAAALSEESSPVPLPGPETRAVYRAVPLGDGPAYGVGGIVLNWREPELAWDDHYVQRLVWPVDIEVRGPSQHRLWAVFDAETGAPLFDGQETTGRSSGNIVIGGAVSTGGDSSLAFDLFHEMRGLCGLLDGPRIDGRAETVMLNGHCSRLDGSGVTEFRRVGHLSYQNPDDPRFQVTYQEGVPVPTTLTVPLSDMILRMPHTSTVWRMELESWSTEEPYVPGPSLVDAMELPRQLPRTAWGLDDRGLDDHPFRLSEAHAAALDDDPEVRGFMAEHPSAYLRSAWSNRERDGSGNFHYNWYLSWTDGQDFIGRRVTLHPGGAAGITSETLPTTIEIVSFTPSDHEDRPDPSRLPATMPDPAQVIERHRILTDEDDFLNRYGFQIVDWGDGLIVAGGAYTYDSSSSVDAQAALRTTMEGRHHEYNQLMVYGDGTAVYNERAMYRTRPLVGPVATADAVSPDRDDGGLPPAAQVAAGVGVFAVLAGLLAYFAPSMKAMAVPLFSRIHRDALLDHPTRAAIMAAVEADPGIHFQALLRHTDTGASTLQHHLRKLTESGHLCVQVSPGYNCYFPRRTDRAALVAAPFLRAAGPKTVLADVVQRGNGTVQAISDRTGLSKSTVSHHLRRMRDAGLLEGGGRDGFRPTELATRAVATA